MSNVLIPFGREYIALTRDEFDQALDLGRKLMPSAEAVPHAAGRSEVLDAESMEQRTRIPASWWLEQARRDAVPHIRAGKYVRFELDAALDALRSHRPTVKKAGTRGIRLAHTGS